MQRRVTALVALVALAALAGAAATLDALHRPAVGPTSTPGTDSGSGVQSGPAGSGPSADGGPEGVIDGASSPPSVTAPSLGGAYVLAILVGILACFVALAVALTGDDGVDSFETPPEGSSRTVASTVDPTYRDTAENRVYAAWKQLADRVADSTASPRDVSTRT